MKLDTDQAWCKIHPSGEDLKKEMLEVAKHTITNRKPNEAWAEDLVFIAPYKTERATTVEIQTGAGSEKANSPEPQSETDGSSSSSSSSDSNSTNTPSRPYMKRDEWREVGDDHDEALKRMDGDGQRAENGTTFAMRLAKAIGDASLEYDRKEEEKNAAKKSEWAKYVLGLFFPGVDMDKAEAIVNGGSSSGSDGEVEEDPGEGPSETTRDKNLGSSSDSNDSSPASEDDTERDTRSDGPLRTYDWEGNDWISENAQVYLGILEENWSASIPPGSRKSEKHSSKEGEEDLPPKEDSQSTFDSGSGNREARLDSSMTEGPGTHPSQGEPRGEKSIIETSEDITDELRTTSGIPEPQPRNEERNEQQSHLPVDSSASPSEASIMSGCECSHIPTFAPGLSPSIKLLRHHALWDCNHFVAVSYCWQSSLQPLPPDPDRPEWIMHVNLDEERPIRAPRRTLERALEYAKAVDVALVWIDQECIEQDNPNEKELAIHSMDLVYQRANYPIGLLDSYITSQGEIDAFDMAMNGDIHSEAQLQDLVLILETLANDLWFTRGWILQESTSTGLRMVLLLQHDPQLERKFGKPCIKGEVCFDLLDLAKMSERLHRDFYDGWFFDHPEPRIRVRYHHGRHDFATTPRYEGIAVSLEIRARILKAAERLMNVCMTEERALPRAVAIRHTLNGKTPRLRYSAARALEILGNRKTSIVSDRVAILGNICNYKIRLDTTKIHSDTYSFSVCALTLAILNGDMSLLPEFADQADGSRNKTYPKPDNGFSWFPMYTYSLGMLPKSMVDEHWCGLQGVKLTPDGLRVPGWLWVVDRKIDLSGIQAKYHDLWVENYDIPPERPRRDPEFDYPYKGPLGVGQHSEFIKFFFWDLLLDLFMRDEHSLCELLWTQVRQEVGHTYHDPKTETTHKRTEPLPESFSGVVYKDPAKGFRVKKLPGTRVDHVIRDFINDRVEAIDWAIDQVLRHGYLLVGRCINTNAISIKPEDSAVLFQTQKMGNFFTPLSLLSFPSEGGRLWPKWARELTWKVEWMGRQVDGLQVFRCRRLFSGIATWSRYGSMEDEVLLE